MFLFLVWVAVIAATLYIYLREQYSFFSRFGVKTLPTLPLLGNIGSVITRREHVANVTQRLYVSFPEERFVGRYDFLKPVILIRDPQLIKNIVMKDFDHFVDHRSFVDEQTDPLFGRNLFSLKGEEWKDMRATLSPAFTSSKIRNMVPFIVEVVEQMINSVKKNIEESGAGYTDLDVKDLTARLANDVIATCAFGLKVDSHKEQDNLFYRMGKETTTFQFRRILVVMGFSNFPRVLQALKISFFKESVKDFFRNLVMSTMRNREEKAIIRPDMIHLLMEAKKGKLIADDHTMTEGDAGFATVEESLIGKKVVNRAWSDDDLTAQAILFFIAGFDTISTALSFLLHEVALNPEVQERLVQEIKETHVKNGGKFDYSCIQDMTYMDMVLSETLRKWPIVVNLDRKCVQDYNCGKPNSKAKLDFILPKGTTVNIPTWPIHNDPAYFPDPEKFNPERFSEENKHSINPFTYMPFGLGPRNCIGSRFALCEVKVVLYHLLRVLEVSPCEKTNVSGRLDTSVFTIRLGGGHWLRFKVRA